MKSFLNACGIKDSLRLTVEGPGAMGGEARQFPQPFAVVGRDDRADVILDDPRVSRRHLYLQAVGGWLFWVDLESRTGTRTEAGVQKSGWLEGRSFLRVGPYLIRRSAASLGGNPASGEHPRDTPLAAQTLGREPLPAVALEFLNGPSQAMHWPMHRVMSLIGSAKGCKFRLTDPSVSAFHASLLRTPVGLWVVDLRGNRSVTVNAVPVRSSPLIDGDVLGIGRYRIRIQCRDRDEQSGGLLADSAPGAAARVVARRIAGGSAQRLVPIPGEGANASSPGLISPTGPVPSLPLPIVAAASSVEVVSSDAIVPNKLAQSELQDSVLMPLVNQFSLMQQQMFDQFQQAMGMLVQMFGNMHREQMAVIREELDRLHELSHELQELKAELARSPRRSAVTSGERTDLVTAAALDRRPASEPSAPAAGARAREGNVPPAFAGPSAVVPPRAPVAAAAEPSPSLGSGFAGIPSLSTPTQAEPSMPESIAQSAPGVPGSSLPEHDAVAWIHQRIMTIQSERETRWQKILKLLPGIS